MSLKILILGVNGFIGNALTTAILKETNWQVFGMDIASDKLSGNLSHPHFHFIEGDISINKEWIAYHIKKCDVALPLVAIATPSIYVKDPLRVFELDFESNLDIVRQCLKYKTRVIFPSTSEVYGMCNEPEFNEETSNLVLGPIQKERWIYSASKQLLDRVIYAYGKHQGLAFTLFRPFNWIGPKQDNVFDEKEGSSRVVSQFISNIIHKKNIHLVDGGAQRRSFTFLDDGIDCLLKIIENKNHCANGKIFNIGNPANDASIKILAETILALAKTYPKYKERAEQVKIIDVDSKDYYGSGYQDVSARIPSIKNAEEILGWSPKTDLNTALKKTLDYYLGG
ncbi:MAG: NAD-dependent dehydratase [Gammaproteobacteria bacterium]|jgi:nucleoside-diphosphate-sugar epimerase|nr:NAD-dependent dehydratase [Gammaproteobacteria bacterium]